MHVQIFTNQAPWSFTDQAPWSSSGFLRETVTVSRKNLDVPQSPPMLLYFSVLLSSLEPSDTKVFEPYVPAILGTALHFCDI